MNKVKFLTWALTVPSTPFYPAEGGRRGGGVVVMGWWMMAEFKCP